MVRLAIASLLGMCGGAAAVYVTVVQPAPTETVVVRDIVAVPDMSDAVSEQHRAEGYVAITTVTEVFALPTTFARQAALYALSGRSDGDAVQKLIFEAERIADDQERNDALVILFHRFSELDPQSALALSRAGEFAGIVQFERKVWATWAHNDFDAALTAAAMQDTANQRKRAAQSLYVAFGYLGNETTDEIERRLGLPPDRVVRSQYVYMLADRSMSEAISYVDTIPAGLFQQEAVSWLAYYAVSRDPVAAPSYENRFTRGPVRMRYRQAVKGALARAAPKETVQQLLADGANLNGGEFYSAMSALASTDMESALSLLDSIDGLENRQRAASIIAGVMAAQDPDRALLWAQSQESTPDIYGYRSVYATVLRSIAYDDPQRAIAEIQQVKGAGRQRELMSTVIMSIASNSPEDAVSMTLLIEDPATLRHAEQRLAQMWLQRDPEPALEWILSFDEQRADQLLQQGGWSVMRRDVDLAIRLLPRLSETRQAEWRSQIAERIALERSPTDAMDFVRRWEGERDYRQLQAQVISGIAQTDVQLAWQMAEQLADPADRDAAYGKVIVRHANSDPFEALGWTDRISSDARRAAITNQIFTSWSWSDEPSARAYVSSMAAGPSRDSALVAISSTWRDPTESQIQLVDSIADPKRQTRALTNVITNLARNDPDRARRMLDSADLSDADRERLEESLDAVEMRR
ncbi:MAG: hypothetical protein AAFX44_13565 [Pseudomonadota bacterium]